MFIAQLLFAETLAIIWAKGFAGRIGAACVVGLLIGLFQEICALVDYVVIPMPGELAVKWFFSGLAQVVLLAIVTAWFTNRRLCPRVS